MCFCIKIAGFAMGFFVVLLLIVYGATQKWILNCTDPQCNTDGTICISVQATLLSTFIFGLLLLRRLVRRSDNLRYYQISMKISLYCLCGVLEDIPPETQTYKVTTTYGDGHQSVRYEDRTTFHCILNLLIGLLYGAIMPILWLYLWIRMIHGYCSPIYAKDTELNITNMQPLQSPNSNSPNIVYTAQNANVIYVNNPNMTRNIYPPPPPSINSYPVYMPNNNNMNQTINNNNPNLNGNNPNFINNNPNYNNNYVIKPVMIQKAHNEYELKL